MPLFMGLFRRWLDHPSGEANNQRQSTSGDGSSDDDKRSELMLNFQVRSEELRREFQTEIERLQAELNNAREETNAMQRRHADALVTKEAEYQRLSSEFRKQIDALNNRWMLEKSKSEQLEKTTEDQKTRQQQQLQMQRESNARQLKELQDTIYKQERATKDERTETLRLRNEYQRVLDCKDADYFQLNQQLTEVSKRLEDEVKVSVAEKKRREMSEVKLEYQTKKQTDLDEQYKDAVRQLNAVKETLAKQMEKTEERTKFDSAEKHYKETLARKDSDYLKLEQRLTDMNSTQEHQTKEMNSERRKNKILEKEIKESKERELQLTNQHQQQLNELQGTVDQQMKELEDERRRTTDIQKQRDEALTTNESDRQKFHMELMELKKRFESQSRALQGEKQAREALQIQVQEQKKIERQKDRALESEKQKREALEMQLQEQKKSEYQTADQLQNSVKQLANYGDQILFLTKELETERQKNVSIGNDHQELVRKANSDCQSLRATVTELQTRMENQAKNFLMEKQKSEGLEKQFQWQSEALKYEECQLGLTRKELDEVREMFAKTEIELSNERMQNAFVDIDRRALIIGKDEECKEVERQLTEMREKFKSQTELLTIETQKLVAVSQELEEQKKRQLEIEEQHKTQLRELEEKLDRLQKPGSKEDIEEGPETASEAGRDESLKDATQMSHREDVVIESQKLSMELSVVRRKLERRMEELEKERLTRIAFQKQNKQLMEERDSQMENVAKETEELVNRIKELEVEKSRPSGTENSDNQNGPQSKRDEVQFKAGRDDNNPNQVTEQQDNETISVRKLDSETKKSEPAEMHLTPEATQTQLDEQTKHISQLRDALNREKEKNLKLMIQRRNVRSQRDQVLQQLQFVQQKLRVQMPLKPKPELEATTMDEDRKEISTNPQEKVQLHNQANWKLDNTREATSDPKPTAGEESATPNRLNPLKLDGNKIQELRERMKTLQRLGEKPNNPATHAETQDKESQKQQHILTHIKEEPVDTKYEENETKVNSRRPDLEEDPPLKKRRRLEESISTDYYDAPYKGARVIKIKPEPDIKQEPLEEPIVRTRLNTDSKEVNKEPGLITKQELQEEPVVNRTRIKARSILKARSEYTAAGPKTKAPATRDMKLRGPEEAGAVQSFPEEARLVQTLRPQSLTSPVTGVAVLSGSLFVVCERNSVVEIYDSMTFTFSGKVSVEGLMNPQFLTACPLNGCLYILNRAQPSNAIYRLGLAPHWHHKKWLIGADFGGLSATDKGSLLLSCFDLKVKEFSTNGQLIRQFQFGQRQSTTELRLFGAVQLQTKMTAKAETAAEEQYVISYSHRSTGLRRVCTVDGNRQVVTPLLKYNGSCTSQHLIIGSQTGALFLADFGLGEVFQWNPQLMDCRTIRRKKDSEFRPLRICLDKNDKRLIVAEVALSNGALGMSRISVYDL